MPIHQSCEEELHALVDRVNHGDFINSNQNPVHLIKLLDKILEEVSAVHSRLLGLSKWKEAITGLSYDLTNVNRYPPRIHFLQHLINCLCIVS